MQPNQGTETISQPTNPTDIYAAETFAQIVEAGIDYVTLNDYLKDESELAHHQAEVAADARNVNRHASPISRALYVVIR